ncbi:MAG: hypothetical protein BroJett011_31970 [Chloroflexota bacterium]|nr:MAG: hypothetical protein BroJett011_31970 [Chloroflexota bacterium]
MVNKTLQNIQAKLKKLALTLPQLQTTGQWTEILHELEGLSQNTQRQELLLEAVAAISDAASSILDVDDLLRVAVNLIQDYFDLYYVAIYLVDESNQYIKLRAGTGEAGKLLLQQEFPQKIGEESMVSWSVQHRQSLIALDGGAGAAHFQNPYLPDTRSEMTLPLINRGQVIGALDLQSSEPGAFAQGDITLFQTLADQLANTIQNTQLFTANALLLDQAENSRRFLKTVIEHIPDPIFIKDKHHTLLEMNQANAQVIGRPQQELIGKTDRDFLRPDLAEKFYRRDKEVFTNNQIFEAEDKTIWGDGRERIGHTRLIPIPNAAGKPEYLLGITQDVTEVRAREAERERMLAETAALYLGSRAIASAMSERQIFEAIFDQIRLADPCEISAFRFNLVDNEPVWAELKFNWQKRNTPSYAVGTRFYLPEFDQSKLLTSSVPLFIDDIATAEELSEAERASFEPTGACSAAILPLAAANQQLGAILVYFTRPYTFTEEVQRLWLAMADQVYIALINRQLIEEAAYRATRMETAAEVARAASSVLEVQDLLDSAVALICDRFELYYVGAFLVDEAKEWAVLKAGTGQAGQIQLQKRHRLKIGGESMIGWSVYHRQPRIALDVGKEAVRFQNPDLPQTRSEIALPLIYHNEAIGALTVQSDEPAAFSREDIIVLQTMADQLANAVKSAQLYEQARQELGERKRAEEALRASEVLYQSLVDNIPQNILRKDRAGRFVFGNKSFCNSLGVSLEELIGKTDFDFYPPELAQKYQQDDRRVIETGQPFETVEEHQTKAGENLFVRVVKSPIFDASGVTVGIQAIFWDITERKKAEEALRESEQRLELALHGADLGLWDYNVQTGVDIVDERAAAMLGYLLDEVEPCVEWWDSRTHPDDLPQAQVIWNDHLAGKTAFYECEYRLRTKAGEWIWILDRGNAVGWDEAGQPLRVAGTHLDITERKHAEALLTGQQRVFEMIAKGASLQATLNVLAEFIEGLSDKTFYASIMLLDGTGTHLRSGAAPSLPQSFIQAIDGLVIGPKVGSCGTAAYRGEQVISPDIAADPLWVDYAEWITSTYGLRACWSTPILATDGKVLGTFAMYHAEPHTPVAADLELIDMAVQLAGIAIERKQAEEALEKALARTQLLYNISEALATLINRRAAFETVLGEYLLLLNLKRGGIMLLDPAGENNMMEALYIDNKVVEPDLVFPAKEDLVAQHLLKNPFPLVIEDVPAHPLTQHNQTLRGRVEAMLLIPIVTRGEVVGIVGADATEKGHIFTPEDIEIGKVLADQLAIWLDNNQLLTEAQYRSERLQTAAEVSRAASSILDVNELSNTSVNLIRDQFDFYYVGLFLADEAREWAVLRAGTGEAGRIQLENKHRLKIGGESMIGWSIQNRQARIALDVGQEAVRFHNPHLPDTHSEMALPLISRDEVIGALTVQSTERGAFSAEDITLLQTMADQLANAIENARLFESVTQAQYEAEALLKDTQALQQFSQMLAGTLQVQEIMNIFFEACETVLGFEYAQFCLVDKYQHRVKAVAGFGVSESQIKQANHSLDSQDIMADIIRTGQTEIITGWDDRFDRELFEAEQHANWIRVFTPVTLRQENIGLIEAGFNKSTEKSIEEAQIRLLRAFIDQTALALDNAQRYEASQKAARREALIKEITTKVRASTNVDTILQTTVKELGDALGSQRAYVHLVAPANGDTH